MSQQRKLKQLTVQPISIQSPSTPHSIPRMLLVPPLVRPRRLPTLEGPRLRPHILVFLPRNRQTSHHQFILDQLPPSDRLVLVDRSHAPATDGDIRVVLSYPPQLAGLGELFGLFFRLEGGVEVGEGVGRGNGGVTGAVAAELGCALDDLGCTSAGRRDVG